MDYKHLVLEDTALSIETHRAIGLYPKKFVFATDTLDTSYLTSYPGAGTQIKFLTSKSPTPLLIAPLTINPTIVTAPLVIGPNGQGVLVVGLNADKLDGQDGSYWANLNWTKTGGNIYPTTLTDSIGIGTATPQASLHVEGDIVPKSDSTCSLGSASRRYAVLYLASTVNFTSDLVFNSSGEKIRFTTSGNVGIGTANPLSTLHVNGSIQADSIQTPTTTIGTSLAFTSSTVLTISSGALVLLTPTTTRIEITNTHTGNIEATLQTSALVEGTILIIYYKNDNGKQLTINSNGSDWVTLQGNSMMFIKTSNGWSPIVKNALN